MMDKIKLYWSKTNRWHYAIFIFLLVELRVLPGNTLGFTCNDPALSHPYSGDTITWKQLFGVVLLLPLAVMLIVERCYHASDQRRPKRRALRWYKEYAYGLLINLVFIQSLKLAVGAPRPHFFDTCSPKEAATCEGSEYISRYICTKAGWLSQSDRSFPSGHTSLAVHMGLFLIYYLHKRAFKTQAILLSQTLLVLMCIICGVSRMWDHRHHWWDVTAGAIIALPIAIYTIVCLCQNFKTKEETMKSSEIDQMSTQVLHTKDRT